MHLILFNNLNVIKTNLMLQIIFYFWQPTVGFNKLIKASDNGGLLFCFIIN